ncbi:retrotransposon protein, putative, unclassified [Senna tora]|uniref:Retrotransposon protein, putative, unclassified n=1 Tax=Senna tora TaxID=362788 RepID=A0A834T5X9_9FABA|nr:retrotransposon protein, putative, unclassified [Senna tora]
MEVEGVDTVEEERRDEVDTINHKVLVKEGMVDDVVIKSGEGNSAIPKEKEGEVGKDNDDVGRGADSLVLREISNTMTYPNVETSMKENVDPEVIVMGVTRWKRMARTITDTVVPNQVGPILGKRREVVNDSHGEVGVGSRPSHTWRSLLAGRELLAKGLQKYVGDGKSTLIWKEPWIPGLDANEPLLPKGNAPIVTWVYELMNNGGRSWNEQKLEDVFDMEICRKIKCVPLRRYNQQDVWFWRGEANGNFSVKSCYKLAMKEVWNQINIMPDLFCSVPDDFWKSIWNLPLLSRYKLFMWRACVGIIPCVGALRHRGMQIEDGCIMCGTENEDVYHALIECSTLEPVWNLKKFQSEVVSLNNLWPRVERCWDELVLARQIDTYMLEGPPNLQWEKPRQPFIKLNVDATVKSNGDGALGGVLQDCDGSVICAFTGSTPALKDVALLEAMAVEKGMYVAREVGVKHIIVKVILELW